LLKTGFGGGREKYFSPRLVKFFDASVEHKETHAVLDFQAGKDVGVGFWGRTGDSAISLGVRYAQQSSKSKVGFKADPDYDIGTSTKYQPHNHVYQASSYSEGSFWAVGPTVSWTATVPFMGTAEGAHLAVDWGLNAAVLFGKAKSIGSHQTSGAYYTGGRPPHRASGYQNPIALHRRSQSITVPNVGGFLGLSLKYPNAKLSLGYRGDFFFSATDGGIDTHKIYNRDFYGPFATISFGLGG
jgi:hypothetical protein